MSSKQNNQSNGVDAEIEAMLAGLDETLVDNAPVPSSMIAETIEIESDEVLDEVVAEIESDQIREQAYATEPPEVASVDASSESVEATAVEDAKPEKKARKARVATIKPPKTPRAPSVANLRPSEALRATMTDDQLREAAFTGLPNGEDVGTFLSRMDTLAKKVGQKAVNFLRYADNSPSRVEGYVRHGLKLLIANRKVTCGDLYAALRGIGYTDGTARSQSSQLNILFPALGLATKNGRELEINNEHPLLKRYIAATA